MSSRSLIWRKRGKNMLNQKNTCKRIQTWDPLQKNHGHKTIDCPLRRISARPQQHALERSTECRALLRDSALKELTIKVERGVGENKGVTRICSRQR